MKLALTQALEISESSVPIVYWMPLRDLIGCLACNELIGSEATTVTGS